MSSLFYVSYPGELTPEDHAALSQPGVDVFPDGSTGTEAFWASESPPTDFESRQWVRLEAEDEDHAKRRVIEALGHEPEDLEVLPGRS